MWRFAGVRFRSVRVSSTLNVTLTACGGMPVAPVSTLGTSARFLIADDTAMFSEALRGYLQKSYTVIGVVRDGLEMVAAAMRLRPDVIVADIGLPLLNGLDAARRVKAQAPNIQLVFLTM